MANTLKFKRGLLAGLPTAAEGEPLFTTDTADLYIGTSTGNQRFQKYIASGTTSQYLRGDGSLATFPTNVITGSAASGQVAYFTGATTQAGNNNLFWDITNARLGIGLNNPVYTFHALSSASTIGAFRNSGAAIGQLLVGNTAGDLVLRILASGDAFIYSDTGKFLALGSNGGIERVRIFSTGNVGVNTASSDTGQRFQVNGNIYFNGSTSSTYIAEINQTNTTAGTSFGMILRGGTNVSDSALRVQNAAASANLLSLQGDGSLGLGTTLLTGYNVRISKSLTNAVSYGVAIDGTIQETVSSTAVGFYTALSTLANVFTLPNLYHFNATQGTFGVGSVVTNQYGYRVSSNMIGASNNYGFYSEIPSGTGRWNFYSAGTANSYFGGSVGIGNSSMFTKLNIRHSNTTVYSSTNSATWLSGINLYNDSTAALNISNLISFYGSSNVNSVFGVVQNASGVGDFIFSGYNGSSFLELMRLTAGGRLGINIQNPTAIIEAVGVSGTSLIRATVADTNGNADVEIKSTGTLGSSRLYFSDTAALSGSILYNHSVDAMLFGTNGTTDRMRLTNNGNLFVGTFTSDTGERLQVIGNALIKGSGTTSATTALTVQNSAASNSDLLKVRNDGPIIIGYLGTSASPYFYSHNRLTPGTITNLGVGLSFAAPLGNQEGTRFWFGSPFSQASQTGTNRHILVEYNVNEVGVVTGATSTYSNMTLSGSIAQGVGSTGITRGLYVNYTLTSAADFRAIDWSNNSGWGLYGSGTANSYFGGHISIGTTSTTNWLNIAAGTTAKAQINLAASTAPTTPNNGDIWFDGTDIKMRIGGVTKTFTLI